MDFELRFIESVHTFCALQCFRTNRGYMNHWEITILQREFARAPWCHWGNSEEYGNARKSHDDVIKWKHFPSNWPFLRGIHRSPVNFPHKGQWRGALMFSLICVWINDWVNNREAGDLRRYRAHYDVTLMPQQNRMHIPWDILCLLVGTQSTIHGSKLRLSNYKHRSSGLHTFRILR